MYATRPRCGGMCEWLKQAVLKTRFTFAGNGGSNPSPSAKTLYLRVSRVLNVP